MWLLHTKSLELEEFFDLNTPSYAILSHTWGNEEISFVEMQSGDEATRRKAGFKKIENFCTLADEHGFTYGWADSCCIDKRSSAELSEAINSMYRYYYNAAECLVYLEDVPVKGAGSIAQLEAIKSSRWFTRGWTLQELVASNTRRFYACDWSPIEDFADFNAVVAGVTGIDALALEYRGMLSSFPVAERMCWAAKRQTTRSEDMAYSLMGLFDVSMPVIYGEGARKSFRRLQNEIMQTSFDQTLFAWRGNYESSGLLATSPADFENTPHLALWQPYNLSPFAMTNIGLSIRLLKLGEAASRSFFTSAQSGTIANSVAALQCHVKHERSWKFLVVYIEPIENANILVNGKSCKGYRRVKCSEWLLVDRKALQGWPGEDVLVLEDEHHRLLRQHIPAGRQ
jgi:hypothetical protein